MERVIVCPVCGDENSCFEDVQETFSSFMCFNCGMMSHSQYTEEKVDTMEHTSQLIKDLAFSAFDIITGGSPFLSSLKIYSTFLPKFFKKFKNLISVPLGDK